LGAIEWDGKDKERFAQELIRSFSDTLI
jgi:hypothetical protein